MTSPRNDTDPLCDRSGPGTYWTTNNISEGLPDVLSPLTWSLWGPQAEIGTRRAVHRLGIFPRSEVRGDIAVEERFFGVFFGRAAMNVDTYRRVADLTPGMSADSSEMQLLGTVRDGTSSDSTWRRLPYVATRLPATFLAESRRIRSLSDEQRRWWQAEVLGRASGSTEEARSRLAESTRRLEIALEHHTFDSMIALGLMGQIEGLSAKSGHEGLETRLVTGYGGFEEQELVADLWQLSQGTIARDTLVERFGFYGPGELTAHSWREDPDQLEDIAAQYRSRPDMEKPEELLARQVDKREEAEAELLDGLPTRSRPGAKLVLSLARRGIPLREVGKAMFLMAIDGARAAARALGHHLVDDGVLEDPGDVFFLTLDELARPPTEPRSLVAERRTRRAEYEDLEIPEVWYGTPSPASRKVEAEPDGAIEGIPVTPGVVVAPARVVSSLAEAQDVNAGDVLVCRTTDPSWVSVFPLASALAIDVGSTASHGAIVARELGIPCVINTLRGTKAFSTGDVLRLDGTAGTVELVERAR